MTGYLDRARARAALPIKIWWNPADFAFAAGYSVQGPNGLIGKTFGENTAAEATAAYRRLVAEMEGRS